MHALAAATVVVRQPLQVLALAAGPDAIARNGSLVPLSLKSPTASTLEPLRRPGEQGRDGRHSGSLTLVTRLRQSPVPRIL